jgi:hypothetical protein
MPVAAAGTALMSSLNKALPCARTLKRAP